MIRIVLVVFGLMVMMCTGGAVFAKYQIVPFKNFAVVEQGDSGAELGSMWLAQNNDEGNNRQRCGRRDRPPLSS